MVFLDIFSDRRDCAEHESIANVPPAAWMMQHNGDDEGRAQATDEDERKNRDRATKHQKKKKESKNAATNHSSRFRIRVRDASMRRQCRSVDAPDGTRCIRQQPTAGTESHRTAEVCAKMKEQKKGPRRMHALCVSQPSNGSEAAALFRLQRVPIAVTVCATERDTNRERERPC